MFSINDEKIPVTIIREKFRYITDILNQLHPLHRYTVTYIHRISIPNSLFNKIRDIGRPLNVTVQLYISVTPVTIALLIKRRIFHGTI